MKRKPEKPEVVLQHEVDKVRQDLLEVRNGMHSLQYEMPHDKTYAVRTALKYLIDMVDRCDETLLRVYEEKET